MKILACGLTAALLLCAGAAQAGPAPATVPATVQDQPAELDALQRWLADVSTWSLGYDTLTHASLENLSWMVDSAGTLVLKLDAGGPAAATPWATQWAAEARDRLARERDIYTGLSPHAPPLPANIPMTPELRRRLESISQMSDQVGSMMLAVQGASDRYITVMTEAAAGRDPGLKALEGGRLGLIIAQLDAENTMIRASSGGLTGPNLHFARAQMAMNGGLKTWLMHNQRLFTGQSVDTAATLADLNRSSAEMRSEIASMRQTIISTRTQIRESGMGGTPFADVLMQVLLTLEESATVESRLADTLDSLKSALASGDETADDAIGASIAALTDERMRIDVARRELLARNAR
ncbi:hypothetical protein [Brevundimonas sp. FT23028]|uniref:hypothetical protein n=1 Tax=Brevundimonas sp. FT23028 TaxID=3393748 RepID=UPI003B589EC8